MLRRSLNLIQMIVVLAARIQVWDDTGARVPFGDDIAVRYGGGAGRAVTVRACLEPVEDLERAFSGKL
jgi:hypothetical protein